MNKAGGSTARRPPAPSQGHAEVEAWAQDVMPRLQPLVQRLDALIRETLPDLRYAVKWKKAFYGLPGRGWVIEMTAYDVSVNVLFFAGAQFDPPPPLGTTGRSRYVKVRTLAEAEQPLMRTWLEQAGRFIGWL